MLKLLANKWSFLFKVRLFFGGLLLFLILIFVFLKISPFGHISYVKSYPANFKLGKGFILNFSPAERVDLTSGIYPRVIADPLYFSVFMPRTYDKGTLTIKYRDNLGPQEPIIGLGVLADNIVWRYDVKPVQNKILDSIKKEWLGLENGSIILLQREKQYDNWVELESDLNKGQLKNCPEGISKCLATYNYSPPVNYEENINKISAPLVIDTPLRGAHQFYVYLNAKSLSLELDFINIYPTETKKPVVVNLYSVTEDNRLISSQSIDNNLSASASVVKKININEENLIAGLYKVEIKIKDDTIIKKISSSADKLVFINKIWPVSANLPLSLWTDANYLQAKVYSPASRQTIEFAGKKYVLDNSAEQFDLMADSPSSTQEIKLIKDDVILENNGVFAFSRESLFNPAPINIDRFFKLNEDIKYIIADYEAPLNDTEDGFKVKSVEFNMKGVYRENNKVNFMISIPGLKKGATSSDYIEIKEIRLDFNGRSIWQKIFNKAF